MTPVGEIAMGTLAETLSVVAPDLSAELVPPEHLAEIDAIARLLPGAIATGFGFECHLGGNVRRADFLLRIKASEVGRDILAGDYPSADLPSVLIDQPIWARLREFGRNWAQPASILHGQVETVWLEFDIDPDLQLVPVPSFFFAPSDSIRSQIAGSCEFGGGAPRAHRATAAALQLVLGNGIPFETEQRLFAIFDALPQEATVFQVGVMLGRQSDAIRLCIDLPKDQVVGYLNRFGWPGPDDELAAVVDRLSSFTDCVVLDVDVAASLLPQIGLECYLTRQPTHEPRWGAFLDHLVGSGLCRPEQRDALLDYPGYVRDTSVPGAWPEHLLQASRFLGSKASSVVARVLHHIKIGYQPGSPLRAKAYLGAFHHWLTPRPSE